MVRECGQDWPRARATGQVSRDYGRTILPGPRRAAHGVIIHVEVRAREMAWTAAGDSGPATHVLSGRPDVLVQAKEILREARVVQAIGGTHVIGQIALY